MYVSELEICARLLNCIYSCSRLGLTTLAYLWQRKQDELLQEMIDWGLNAIIIKVAGVGLTVRHLGMSLRDMRDKLFQLVRTSYTLNKDNCVS